jgi:hypothetical protein
MKDKSHLSDELFERKCPLHPVAKNAAGYDISSYIPFFVTDSINTQKLKRRQPRGLNIAELPRWRLVTIKTGPLDYFGKFLKRKSKNVASFHCAIAVFLENSNSSRIAMPFSRLPPTILSEPAFCPRPTRPRPNQIVSWYSLLTTTGATYSPVDPSLLTEPLAPNNCKMTNFFTCTVNKFHPASIA